MTWTPVPKDPQNLIVPVMIGRVGDKRQAMAIFHGQCWRHVDSLEPVCFEPTHFHYLQEPPK